LAVCCCPCFNVVTGSKFNCSIVVLGRYTYGFSKAKRKEFYRKNGITKGDDDMLSTFEDALKDLEDRMAADNDAEIKKLLAEKDAVTRKLLAEKDAEIAEKDAVTRKLLAENVKLRSLLKNK